MALPKPYGGLSNDRLTALINEKNPDTPVQEGVDFMYGLPRDYTDDQGRNSVVSIAPVSGTHYTQAEDIHYTRLPLSVLGLLPVGFVKQVVIDSLPFSIHGSLAAINAALGLDLVPEEVEDVTYSEEQDTYVLHALGDISLAWTDSTYEFQVRLPGQDIPLSEVIVNTHLTGLVYVQMSV
ncbi:hypothetical protein [Burkholderia phage FLC9]|nr:hypothetical protein [Burkholderia phage FLC9]